MIVSGIRVRYASWRPSEARSTLDMTEGTPPLPPTITAELTLTALAMSTHLLRVTFYNIPLVVFQIFIRFQTS